MARDGTVSPINLPKTLPLFLLPPRRSNVGIKAEDRAIPARITK